MSLVTTEYQKGFTLVEIAIVLVIVGLLLGGVLKGQELITNAEIKNFTTDLEEVVAATYAYQDRMGRFPGDLGQPGYLDLNAFWRDLEREGFIFGSTFIAGIQALPHRLNGFFVALPPGIPIANSKRTLCATNVEESIAQGIDRKLDDGIPNTGDILVGNTLSANLTDYSSPESVRILCKIFK